MVNRPHLLVSDIVVEQQRWLIVKNILQNFCKTNQVGFNFKWGHRVESFKENKILVPFVFDLIPHADYLKFAEDCKKLGKKAYVITDNWVDQQKFQHPSVHVYCYPELLGFTSTSNKLKVIFCRNKLYNAFIHRAEPVRQSWFYFLYLNGLLDQGHVSYMLYQPNSSLTEQELFENIHRNSLSMLPKFNHAYNNLKKHVPYRNFVDNSDLSTFILDSKYSLVLDTYSPDDDVGAYYVSEKVTRALQYPNINLLFLQKGTLKKLNQSGFYIEPMMLEIDQLGWIERQQKILEVLSNNLIYASDSELLAQATHNRNILSKWLSKCTDNAFYEQIFEKIISD